MDEISDIDPEVLADELARLRVDHRRVDQEIAALQDLGVADMLKVRRMKKIKLAMRDRIRFLEDQLTPDIIA